MSEGSTENDRQNQEKSSGMFCHAFTGCDASSFRVKGKRTAWQALEVFPEVSLVLKKLRQYPHIIDDADLNILKTFVIIMHDKYNTTGKVEEARLDLFAWKPFHRQAHPSFSKSSKLPAYGAR